MGLCQRGWVEVGSVRTRCSYMCSVARQKSLEPKRSRQRLYPRSKMITQRVSKRSSILFFEQPREISTDFDLSSLPPFLSNFALLPFAFELASPVRPVIIK